MVGPKSIINPNSLIYLIRVLRELYKYPSNGRGVVLFTDQKQPIDARGDTLGVGRRWRSDEGKGETFWHRGSVLLHTFAIDSFAGIDSAFEFGLRKPFVTQFRSFVASDTI